MPMLWVMELVPLYPMVPPFPPRVEEDGFRSTNTIPSAPPLLAPSSTSAVISQLCEMSTVPKYQTAPFCELELFVSR